MLRWILTGVACLSVIAIALLIGFYVSIWVRYASSPNDYLATCKSAATRLPIAVEFEELFPGQTDHFITHYGFNRHGGDPTNTWNSEAYFAGRYSLTMQVEVVVDYENNTVTPAGEPTFYLLEITSFNGRNAKYQGAQESFGLKEWQKIYDDGGEFSAVGLKIQKNAPIPNFDQLVEMVRRPRIPRVTLLDIQNAPDEK